MGNPQKKKQAI